MDVIEQKIRDQFSEAIDLGEHWIKMQDKNLPKSKEVLTVSFVGRGEDVQGAFLLVFQHFAESDKASTHKCANIKHFMPVDVFASKWPDLFRRFSGG